jgi:hypothetical protein
MSRIITSISINDIFLEPLLRWPQFNNVNMLFTWILAFFRNGLGYLLRSSRSLNGSLESLIRSTSRRCLKDHNHLNWAGNLSWAAQPFTANGMVVTNTPVVPTYRDIHISYLFLLIQCIRDAQVLKNKAQSLIRSSICPTPCSHFHGLSRVNSILEMASFFLSRSSHFCFAYSALSILNAF